MRPWVGGGSLYATVNTAGMAVGKATCGFFSEAEYDAMMGINAKAAFFVMQEARPPDGGTGGRILNVLTSLFGGVHAVVLLVRR